VKRVSLITITALAITPAFGMSQTSSAAPVACTPGYSPCLPAKADLDFGQINDALKPVRVTGEDPYALDRDRDGLGCEVAGQSGGAKSPWGLILRNPPKKEAVSAKVGMTLRAVGWSPASFKGETYELCAQRGSTTRCLNGKAQLAGRTQMFGTWKILATL